MIGDGPPPDLLSKPFRLKTIFNGSLPWASARRRIGTRSGCLYGSVRCVPNCQRDTLLLFCSSLATGRRQCFVSHNGAMFEQQPSSNHKRAPPRLRLNAMQKHTRQKMGRCIFCGQKGRRTRTHVWPEWLKSVLSDGTHRISTDETVVQLNLDEAETMKQSRVHQGGLFSQKPFLACERCNTGWMHDFEEQVVPFARTLFASDSGITLTRKQVISLCGWVSLIAILAEYNKTREKSTIPKIDRLHIREHLAPPTEWSIFACSQDNPNLSAYHRIVRKWYEPHISIAEHAATIVAGRDFNIQLSTFGLGQVFLQLFTSPYMKLVDDFRVFAKSQGLVQLWPMPSSFNPFGNRFAKFPTTVVFNAGGADEIASAYSNRFDVLFGAGMAKRFRI
jgi:hypothetical protein